VVSSRVRRWRTTLSRSRATWASFCVSSILVAGATPRAAKFVLPAGLARQVVARLSSSPSSLSVSR
jgi:hypothetical protein